MQVARLRAAGAIVVGKTNVPEFGHTAITKNLLFGESRNPWNLERTPGGSSGGSAAAIAGGVVSLVTASDGGGSVRLPASFTGCFGLKPSFGRIPHESDLWVMDDTAAYGPLTRTVEDAALFLDLAAGPDPRDPNSLPHPGISYRAVLADLPRGLRVGYSPDLGYAVVQSDVAEVALRGGALLRARTTASRSSKAARRCSAASGVCSARSRCWAGSSRCCPSARRSSGAGSSRARSRAGA